METLGKWDVIGTYSLMIPMGEVAKLYINNDKAKLNFEVVFKDEDDNDDSKISFEKENDFIRIIFINWKNSLGSSVDKVSRIASFKSGKELALMAMGWRVGKVNRVDIKFFVEGERA